MLLLAVCGPEMMLWFTIIAARHKTMATVGDPLGTAMLGMLVSSRRNMLDQSDDIFISGMHLCVSMLHEICSK